MAKGDSPALKMRVEGGRMVPMTQWDQERLLSYRNGAEVNVVITQEAASWRRRKYWAILHKVVETCPVKARTAQDLHDAIRREIGFVDAYNSNGTNLRITLKSTSKLDEQAFAAFFDEAIEVLQEWTGLDAETLGKESADVGRPDDHQSSSEASLPHEDDAAGATTQAPAQAPAAPIPDSSQESGREPDGNAGDEPAKPSGSDVDLRAKMQECINKFIGAATDPKVTDAKDRQGTLVFAKNVWKAELKERPDFVKACTDICNKVVKGQMDPAAARAEMERWLP